MEYTQHNGLFTRRRTFTIGPTPQRTSAPYVTRHPLKLDGRETRLRQLQRTSSAPAFTRRSVEPIVQSISKAGKRAARQTHLPSRTSHASCTVRRAGLPPRSRSQDTRTSSEKPWVRRCVSSGATPREAHSRVEDAHAVSPDPREPLIASLEVDPSPAESFRLSLPDSTQECSKGHSASLNAASFSSHVDLVLPSIASSIHSGGLGRVEDASFSPRWYPAWAASSETLPANTPLALSAAEPAVYPADAVTSPASLEKATQYSAMSAPPTSESQLRQPRPAHVEGSFTSFDHSSMLERTPVGRGVNDDVSSLFPNALGHTMPPHRCTGLQHAARSSAGKNLSRAHAYIRVERCDGLPRAPFCGRLEEGRCADEEDANGGAQTPTKAKAKTATRSDEVYVYMRSSRDGARHKSDTVPYAEEVTFTGHFCEFNVPFHATAPGASGHGGEEDEDVLTFTVAVKLTTGKQVKLGISKFALCNLRDGHPTCVSMPIVAKAGTARARERGTLTICVEIAGSGWLPDEPPHAHLSESAVRSRVLAVMRRACRERLDQVEVYVRQHCLDSSTELHHFVAQVEADYVLSQATRGSVGDSSKDAGTKAHENAANARHSASSSSSRRRGSNSSVFTSCVLADPNAAYRTVSHPAESQKETRAADMRAKVRRSATVDVKGDGRVRRLEQKRKDLRVDAAPASVQTTVAFHRSTSAPPLSNLSQVAGSHPVHAQGGVAARTMEQHVRVTMRAVCDLRDEHGLLLQDCAPCFVRAVIVADSTVEHPSKLLALEALSAALTTESVHYRDHKATFPSVPRLLRASSLSVQSVLWCTVYQGTQTMPHMLAACAVSLRHLSSYPTSLHAEEVDCVLVHQAGSPQAYPCGHLRLSLALENCSGPARPGRSAPDTASSQRTGQTCSAALRKRVLSFLWHHRRAALHRLDSIALNAASAGFDAAVQQFCTAGMRESDLLMPPLVCNSVRITLRSVSLRSNIARLGGTPALITSLAPPPSLSSDFYVGWTCGCYGGRSSKVYRNVATAADCIIRLDNALPTLEDLDPRRDELCVALYGCSSTGAAGTAVELCRVHVSVRSFRLCPRDTPETVRLPLVWHAGQRGAFEQGYVVMDVHATEDSNAPATGFRTDAWRGFRADWPVREVVARHLQCYATDQLHRLLPILAEAEGKEDVLVHRLRATYGAASEAVQLRICLVGLRCRCPNFQKCYLKVYHHDTALLRTPTILCNAPTPDKTRIVTELASCNAPDDESTRTVQLLDEDKYLFYVSTAAPHQDVLLFKMGVEHLLKKNDVAAYAEVSLGAFVSLESRLAESVLRPFAQGRAAGSARPPSPHAPFWVLLRNDAAETVAKVALRVEWVHEKPLAPIRRVTTQTKSTVAAVLRTGSGSSGGGGNGRCPRHSIPLFDFPTMRDVYSLLNSYVPKELYRWSWYLSRWADATKAHEKLRCELLSPLVVATVFIDIAGISPRTKANAARLGVSTSDALSVSCFCLGTSSRCVARCPVLPCDATRANAQAATVLNTIDRADVGVRDQQTLRLDLQIPASDSVQEELCLIVSAAPRWTVASCSPQQQARSWSAPRASRRNYSAEHFRTLRSRSVGTAALLHSEQGSSTVSPQRSTSAVRPCTRPMLHTVKSEVGRAYLSLRALLTAPELYRAGEMISVPLVALGSGGDGGVKTNPSVLLGDVYVRVRTPTHESVPKWLRLNDDQLGRINRRGTLSRNDVRARLHQRQVQLELTSGISAVEMAHAHASFFGVRTPSPETFFERSGQATPARVPEPSRPPLAPRSVASPETPLYLHGKNSVFRAHEVFPRADGDGEESFKLDDYTTPRRRKAETTLHEWTAEGGGVTMDRSSATTHSVQSITSASPQDSYVTTKRALVF